MANLPETPQWEDGIYQIEVSDPVLGGPDGISNRQAKQLASRTSYLKQKVEKGGTDLAAHIAAADPHTQYAPKASPTFTGTPTAPTQAKTDNSTKLATTAHVKSVVADYAPLSSPALTGKPTAPTAAQTANDTQLANTAFVKAAIAALVASSPEALDTLKELAAALGNDPNFATTMTNALAGKQPLDNTLTALSGKSVAALLEYLGLGDGTGRLINIRTFTSSGTYIPTAGTKKIRVRIIGGGGAGGGAAASTVSGYLAAGHGGNAGSYGETGLINISGIASVAVTVGAAGVGSAGANGTDGGASSFGGYIIAPGGRGGNYGASGVGSNSWVPDYTQSDECTGTAMLISIPGEGGFGQMSFSMGSAKGGRGGSSVLGTGGSAFVINTTGGYGWGLGGGGAGSVTTYANGTSATAGGHGARGQVMVEEYA